MEYIVPIVILALLGLWGVLIYNKLVYNRNLVEEGWSGIETQLKRRSNLIPNLVEAVKGYVGHEKGVLEKVTEKVDKLTVFGGLDGVLNDPVRIKPHPD